MAIADLAYQHALDRLATVGFDGLTERERDLASLWQVEAEVSNGGFARYYSKTTGDLAFHAPEALERVGAAQKAAIVRSANALFGPHGPPRDRQKRQTALKALGPEAVASFDELEKRFYQDPVDVDELVERSLSPRE